jgi:DNA-directed RNA polymerase specialized sigma24 family protein
MLTLSQQLLEDKNNGLSEAQLAEKHGIALSRVRTLLFAAQNEALSLTERIKLMKNAGYRNVEIADALGLTESEVRILLKGE